MVTSSLPWAFPQDVYFDVVSCVGEQGLTRVTKQGQGTRVLIPLLTLPHRKPSGASLPWVSVSPSKQ